MKDFFVNVWIIVIIAVVVVGTGLGLGLFFGLRGGAEPSAELQSYSVDADGLGGVHGWATGDRWVYSMHMPMDEMGTYDGTVTWTVTGEETVDTTDCYKSNWALDPSEWEVEMDIDGTETMTISVDSWQIWWAKDNLLLPKKMEMEFTATAVGETFSFKMVETYTNSVTGTMWPLEVGNEFTVTTTGTSWFYVDLNGDGDFDDPDELEGPTTIPSESFRYVVEAEEEVTVAAGTFHCFKIVQYDDGNVVAELWYSTDVKNEVKDIQYL